LGLGSQRREILVYDGGYWYKDRELFEAIKNSNIDNLILPHALKQEIREDLARFFAARDTYERYGIPWKRGILLIGPPGNGKTHAVKALINETRKACLYVKSFKACWGTEHDSICRVFKQARRTTPCIVVLEDLDSLIDKSNRSFFLNELDGFAENTGVVILATTNHPDQIDSAIIDRPSRFDRKYFFELPSRAGRRIYFERWQGSVDPDLRLPPDSLSKAAAMTDGFSFAYLKELCLSAMMSWMSDRTRPMEEVLFATAEILLKEVNRGEQSGKKRKSKRKKTMAASAGCEHWS
jgi:SpoVK/Ycf46/Vps4 family AAA+-type ATPase